MHMECLEKAFRLAHLSHHQILALGGTEPMSGAHGVFPSAEQNMSQLGSALNNLALAALKDLAILQQLTVTNPTLSKTNMMLTATNKNLVESEVKSHAAAGLEDQQ